MKRILYFAVAIMFSSHISAQINFDEIIIVGDSFTTTNTTLTVSADLDGDGDLDVLASGHDLNWYENINGSGDFGSKKTISIGAKATSLYATDLDGDNDIDILFSSYYSANFTWFENIDGKGHFELKEIINPGSCVNQTIPIYPTDVDGDGDTDIITSYNGKVIWYENYNKVLNFNSEKTISDISRSQLVTSINSSDLNGDNNMDVVVSSYNNDDIVWYENLDGNGNFGSAVEVTISVDGVKSLQITDIDNDGDMDILSGSENDNKIVWFENTDGNGSFNLEHIITTNATEVQSVFSSDIDNDGDIDVISATSTVAGKVNSPSIIIWHKNDGTGNFITEHIITNQIYGARHISCNDINNDGNIDVILASFDDDKVSWCKNINGNGEFENPISISRSVEFPRNVFAADIDGDNDMDIVSTSHHDAKIAWYENIDSSGFFGNQRIIIEKVGTSNNMPSAFPVDIDGDGDIDIIGGIPAAINTSAKFVWFENNGVGNFLKEHVINNTYPTIVRSADIDSDGDMDIVAGYYSLKKIVWHENLDGEGVFGNEQIIVESSSVISSLEISDLNNDGVPDIMTAAQNNWGVKWFENINGNFTVHYLNNIHETGAITSADINGDGVLDIIAVSRNSNYNDSVSWYEDAGDGKFSTEHTISHLRIFGNSITTCDIDNDGDLDVLTASGEATLSYPSTLAWYENIDGAGNFSDQQIIAENLNSIAYSIYTTDIDGDNNIDVLSAFGHAGFNTRGKISWHKNNGNPLSIDKNAIFQYTVYPNPTTGILNIKSKTPITQIKIYNMLGQMISSKSNNNKVNLSNLGNGIYSVKIEDVNGIFEIKKIIKY